MVSASLASSLVTDIRGQHQRDNLALVESGVVAPAQLVCCVLALNLFCRFPPILPHVWLQLVNLRLVELQLAAEIDCSQLKRLEERCVLVECSSNVVQITLSNN